MFSRLGLLASVVILPLAFSAQKADAAVYTFNSSVTTIETQSASAPPDGLMTMQDGVTTLTFDDVMVGKQPIGFTPPSGTIPGGGVVAGGGNRGLYAPPNGDVSQFYAVALNPVSGPTVPASDTFTTEGYNNYFGLYWGSIDYGNQLYFYRDAKLVVSFTGADFAPADGNQIAPNTNEFIDFFFTDGATYNRVVFYTAQLNFEVDNVAYGSVAVPDPTSFALFSTALTALSFFRCLGNYGQRHSDLSTVAPSRTFDRTLVSAQAAFMIGGRRCRGGETGDGGNWLEPAGCGVTAAGESCRARCNLDKKGLQPCDSLSLQLHFTTRFLSE